MDSEERSGLDDIAALVIALRSAVFAAARLEAEASDTSVVHASADLVHLRVHDAESAPATLPLARP